MKIRALIVDDEPLARERIRSLLRREADFEIAAEAADGAKAIAAIRKLQPDLVFLDAQMPQGGGFDVLDAIGAAKMPLVIFVTAYDQYALRAFDVHALDYLLKPFDRERFQAALRRVRAHIESRDTDVNRRLLALLEERRSARKYVDRLAIRATGRITFLRADEIDWIEAAGNYVRLNAGKESHLLRETMQSLESQLDPQKFMRIHRGIIVNVERIRELQPTEHGDYTVTLRSGARLTLSRSFRDRLKQLLGNLP